MKHKCFLFSLVLVAIAGSMQSCSNDQEPARPNIIFIMSDDHAYQAMSCYDGSLNTTPNIDRIANEGVLFMNSYVTNSICAPSRAVLLIGKWHLRSEPQSFDYWNVLPGQGHYFYHDVDEWELYDMEEDPSEMNNIFGKPGSEKITEELTRKLYELKDAYGDTPELEELHMPFKKQVTDK